MNEPAIYCRLEPSLDSEIVKYVPEEQRRQKRWWDVACYSDRRCRRADFVCWFPCAYASSKPSKQQKHVTLNCARHRLIWLPDKAVKRLPTVKNRFKIRNAMIEATTRV